MKKNKEAYKLFGIIEYCKFQSKIITISMHVLLLVPLDLTDGAGRLEGFRAFPEKTNSH